MLPEELSDKRYLEIVQYLVPKGWIPIGKWKSMRFRSPKGIVHDLSAANLAMLDIISEKGQFVDHEYVS